MAITARLRAPSRRHGVAELVRREAPAHASRRGGPPQLFARGGRGPGAPPGRSAEDARQRSDGQRDAELEPWLKLLPGPVVHLDLAAAAELEAAIARPRA